jgi:hypothetical protein
MTEIKRKFEGYFKKSSKDGCDNLYIQKLYDNNECFIVLSNKMTEAGFYECDIVPMKPPKKGYFVVSFTRNLEKEKKSYQQYLKKEKNKLMKNAKFENKIIKTSKDARE